MERSEVLEILGGFSGWFADAGAADYPWCIEQCRKDVEGDGEFAEKVREAFEIALSGGLDPGDVYDLVRKDFNRKAADEDAAKGFLRFLRDQLFGNSSTGQSI